MMPILDYPGIVKKYLKNFSDFFTEPGLKHFAEYITGLMVSHNKTVSGINDSFIGHRNQSCKNKFLIETNWSGLEINRRKNEIMLSHIKKINLKNGFLIIDDTLIEKTGNSIEGVGIYRDYTNNRYILGHQLVTTYFISKRKRFQFPVDYRLYLKKENTENFKTKIGLAEELVNSAISENIPFSTIIFDSFYGSNKFIKFIEAKGKNWVTRCKSNRLVFVADNKKIPLS